MPRGEGDELPCHSALRNESGINTAACNNGSMHKQIEMALANLSSSPMPKRDRIKAILKRYAHDEIGLDEAYYELLDDELIPMPQRCAVFAKVPVSEQDELSLKAKIKGILDQPG
jgi:hypothetical protein